MERISDSLRGSVRLKIFGAFPAGVLNTAAADGIELWDVESKDENTLCLSAYEGRLERLRQIARRAGCEVAIIRRVGGRDGLRKVLHRPTLLTGLALAVLLLFCSSLFIWDVEVRGAERLGAGEILCALEESGFGVGSFWPGVNTDLLRSEVMVRLPEIGWMTVNVGGSRATVVVVERESKPEMYDSASAVDLVAARDGLVRRVNVLAGSPQVTEREIVMAGQTLIASRTESMNGEARTVRARGSVMADTWYELTAVCPVKAWLKTPAGLPHSRFAVVFGKRRLNLYIGSGNTLDGCDTIISEYTLGIPGLFSTPIRLMRERFVPYKTSAGDDYDPHETGRRLFSFLEGRTEGQILSSSLSPGRTGELYVLTLRAHCTENIAVPRE
ncbi:MAG: sporulation protein YqfD [Oscillospiraceae bacterium]|nr:sporulation protein YqfD [Oscillospiraceae bacterium]